MITRKEYNDALDVVEAYQKQIFTTKIEDELECNKNTKVGDWDKISLCSTRLYNILTGEFLQDGYKKSWIINIEDLTKKQFKKIRNAGEGSWTEFQDLRGY